MPIYEPGLAEIIHRNAAAKRLHFTTELATGVRDADFIFLAVGTPQRADGTADLSAIWSVADELAPHLPPHVIIVTKSTVPVGTNEKLYRRLQEQTGRDIDVASNPEFLKEGAALDDFTRPDRVVVGVRREEVGKRLLKLYKPFLRTDHPFLVMSPESAELTKYVAQRRFWPPKSASSIRWPTSANGFRQISTTCDGVSVTTAALGSRSCFPASGTGAAVFPKTYGP